MNPRVIVEAFEKAELSGAGCSLVEFCSLKPLVAEQYFRLFSGLLACKPGEYAFVVADEEDLAFLQEVERLGLPEGGLVDLFELSPEVSAFVRSAPASGLLRRLSMRQAQAGSGNTFQDVGP